MTQINFRAEIEEYTNRVLGVVKEKYGLKDKSEALDLFADMYGEDFVEHEVKEEVITEILEMSKEYHEKGAKPMSFEELDELTGLKSKESEEKGWVLNVQLWPKWSI